MAAGNGGTGLHLWFNQFEATRQAWQEDRCSWLWWLLTRQPLHRLIRARVRIIRGLLGANLGDWSAAEGGYHQVISNFRDEGNWEAVHRDGRRAWQLALTEGYRDLQARLSLLWGREALL